MTQIEAKALEEFPPDFGYEAIDGEVMEVDVNAPLRAAFIKGCQYAATGSLPMTREECKEWIEKKYEESGNFTWNASTLCLTLYDHLTSLSPAQPDSLVPLKDIQILLDGLQTIEALDDGDHGKTARDALGKFSANNPNFWDLTNKK